MNVVSIEMGSVGDIEFYKSVYIKSSFFLGGIVDIILFYFKVVIGFCSFLVEVFRYKDFYLNLMG